MKTYNYIKNNDIKKENGVLLQRGLVEMDNFTYYMLEDGSYAKGWVCDGEVFRYFDEEGKMLRDEFIKEGKDMYYVDKDGVRFSGKLEKKGMEYYFDRSGRLLS